MIQQIINCLLFPLNFIWNLIKNKLVNSIEQFLANSNIVEGKDIVFHQPKEKIFFDVFLRGNLALGESYMQGLWETDDLFNFFVKILNNSSRKYCEYGSVIVKKIVGPLINSQTKGLSMINKHYNLGNDFFESWLDKNLQYSCGYWNQDEMTLDQAQIAKMNLIGRKLKLEKGMTVLDIGCGWGGLANYLATTFEVKVTGISLSIEQIKYAQMKFKDNPDIEFIYGDFADILKLKTKFDRIVTVGFYEHVGDDRYAEFYDIINKVLVDDGICLLHTIGCPNNKCGIDYWLKKYIFTRGKIPSLESISNHSQNYHLVIDDVQNFGYFYYKTLNAWYLNFDKVFDKDSDPVFYRMWKYYLSLCAAAFYCREIYLWQIIFTKKSNKNVYLGVR